MITLQANDLKACGYTSLALGKWHLGQQPQYLPTARGFDAFLGLPFSVDDGLGIVIPATCPTPPSTDNYSSSTPSANAGLEPTPHQLHSGSSLGPSLPLPLIRQNLATAESVIVEQPTNLRLLNQRLTDAAINFTTAHKDVPFFVYFAFGHVHTATPNVDPDSNPYGGKQYARCSSYGISRRGLFGDALAEVDSAVDQLVVSISSLSLILT